MKRNLHTFFAAAAFYAACLSTSSAQDHEHDFEAPNGGRLVTNVEPHAEIYVADDGEVKVTFLSDHGEVIPPAKQLITLVGGDRMDPIRTNFEKIGESFVSEEKLPMGKAIPLVVQFQEEPGGKTYRERFQLNMSSCPTCKYKEYACTCHEEETSAGDHGHDHDDHSHSH
ncbi:hypothetical protein [Pelagicoccus sp. SDUM812002]|uniref:hypothetical protein n=1 Tax=Pelagicoccus sp. SDUM812002 TaxID=3041266 RepID=UPI00280D7071|nr:hypothetical protein [Pelagicoccus sp. SDUM812002]MDQ8184167.1 hypothetical protein [Pelagicoccus sp. SDUM812002]